MQHLSPLPTHPLEQGQLNNHHTTLFSLLPTLHLSDRSAMLQTVLPSSSMQEVREGKQQSASGPPRRSSRRGAHARTTI